MENVKKKSVQDNKAIVDWFVKLCDKKKIIWLNDLNNKDVPDFIRMKYLSGSLKGVLNSDYALLNNIRCATVELGEVKKKSIIAFNTKHEDYVRSCLKDFKKIKNELIKLDKAHAAKTKTLRLKLLKIGRRYS